jgi:DNA-binding response OmpR family regulator
MNAEVQPDRLSRPDREERSEALRRLLAEARATHLHSRAVIEESENALGRHMAAVVALRSALSSVGRGLTPAPPVDRGAPTVQAEVAVGRLTLVPVRMAVRTAEGLVILTPVEWQLLIALVRNRDTLLSRSDIAVEAWGRRFADRHGEVEVYISRLRRKLARAKAEARIETVRGAGYRLVLGGE